MVFWLKVKLCKFYQKEKKKNKAFESLDLKVVSKQMVLEVLIFQGFQNRDFICSQKRLQQRLTKFAEVRLL